MNAGGKAHCQHFHIEDDIYIEQPVHDVMLADGSIVDFALYTLLKKTKKIAKLITIRYSSNPSLIFQ